MTQAAQDTVPAFELGVADMRVVLALVRGGTLAAAGARLGVDASTVFRAVQRIEKGLGRPLFERSRAGYKPTEPTVVVARHAERMEAELELARSALQAESTEVSGLVRISTTDAVLHGLLLPALASLTAQHPLLQLELSMRDDASPGMPDTDIALRALRRPPDALIARPLGLVRIAAFVAQHHEARSIDEALALRTPWVAVDDALPEHPSVVWRMRHHPKVEAHLRVGGLMAVQDAVAAGMGIGLLPLFLARGRSDLRQISEPLDDAQLPLWLLTHPQSRPLQRVAVVVGHLAAKVVLG